MNNLFFAPIDCIDPNPFQPASARNEEKVLEIAESLVANLDAGIGTQGLNQVPTARRVGDRFQLAFGHHRLQAFVLLFSQGNKAFEKMPLIIEDLTDQQMFEAMATENLQRREISFIEEAEMFHAYMEIFHKNSVETAQRFQKSDEHVRGRIMFLQLPEAAREKAKTGEVNVSSARLLVSAQKIGGEELVKKALKEIDTMKTSRMHDTPQDAIEHAIRNAPGVTRIRLDADWAQANKNFPHKHLPKLTESDLVSILEVSSDSESRKARELQKVIYSGQEFSGEDFPEFSAENFLKLRTLLKPQPCAKCPFHTAIDGSDYCGIDKCMERKKAAWDQKKLADTAEALGIPPYQKSDGRYIQLYPSDAADKKLFNEGGPDLRLAPASYMWNNFEGVGMDLKVVVVGETAEKRLKADEKLQAKMNNAKLDNETKQKIEDTTDQFVLRFGWEVASLAFADALNGMSLPLMDWIVSDWFEYTVEDTRFPKGSDDHDELVVAARKMKKADGEKQMRRIVVYDMLYARHFDIFDDGGEDVLSLAKEMQETAKEWGVKLPKDWLKQAQKYQAELDAAVKEIAKPDKPTPAEKGKAVNELQKALAGRK